MFNILLQILDDGRLSDSRGRVVSFKNTVIILTSNVGAHEVRDTALGFGIKEESSEHEEMKEHIEEALKKQFKPEFLNRIDEIVVFHKLSKEDATKICDRLLNGLAERLKERGVSMRVTARAKAQLVEEGYNEEMGARPLKRTLQRLVEDRLSEELLKRNISDEASVLVDYEGGDFVFKIE